MSRVHDLNKQKGQFFKVLETTEHSQIAVMTIDPGGTSGGEGTHKGDQVVCILEGEAEVHVGKDRVTASAHEAVVIPANTEHIIVNTSKAPVFFFNVYSTPEY